MTMVRTFATDREQATMLAALRLYQVAGVAQRAEVADIASRGGNFTPLSAAEVDALCVGINVRPLPAPSSAGPVTLRESRRRHGDDVLTLCVRCPFFVECYAGWYDHLDNGEVDHDHDAQPGERKTLTEWQSARPELFPPNDKRYLADTIASPNLLSRRSMQTGLNVAARVEPSEDGAASARQTVVIEYHYTDGDSGAHLSMPGDFAERFWATQALEGTARLVVRLPRERESA